MRFAGVWCVSGVCASLFAISRLGGDCAGDAREPARQRGGERDAEAAQRVIQPLEGERVADEDRDAYSHEEV